MRDRHGIYVADLSQREPRRFVRGNAGAHYSRLVARDGVEGERRAIFIRVDYLAVGDESELYQRLELKDLYLKHQIQKQNQKLL